MVGISDSRGWRFRLDGGAEKEEEAAAEVTGGRAGGRAGGARWRHPLNSESLPHDHHTVDGECDHPPRRGAWSASRTHSGRRFRLDGGAEKEEEAAEEVTGGGAGAMRAVRGGGGVPPPCQATD
jgi:hypothetical protein